MENGRIVVITGASSGIGAALAKECAARGHSVVLAARRERELNALAASIGPNALPVVCDVTRRDQVEHLKAAGLKRFGKIDVWVNNAGRGIGRSVIDLSDEDVDAMIAVNLKSALYGIQAIIPHFQERNGGHLINVSTMLSRIPFATFRSAYCAAKAALNALTANLRVDLLRTHPGIHVSLVMPGMVTTDFQKNALHGTPEISRGGSGARSQTSEEVAKVIADLMDIPEPEVYTSPASTDIASRYYYDIAAFEANLVNPHR